MIRSKIIADKSAKELLDLYFLDLRSHLLEVAAGLDRFERIGGEEILDDKRICQLKNACDIIKNGKVNRAEQFLKLFSEV